MTRKTLTLKTAPAQGVPIDAIVERICRNCRFYHITEWDAAGPKAICRKRPPYRDHVTGQAVWPAIYAIDWCGEFKRLPVE